MTFAAPMLGRCALLRATSLRQIFAHLLLAAAMTLSLNAHAQDYPSKQIKIIVPFQPGGGNDRVARIVAEKLRAKWGQPVIIENRAGAGGNIGSDVVFNAAPDGYTLLLTAPGPLVINKSLYAKFPFDPESFSSVSVIATSYAVLTVHPKVPAESVQQLINYAKTHPGRLNFASSGAGATTHLGAELFKSMAAIDMVHVPYKGTGPALADLVSGQVDLMFMEISSVLPHIRAGKLRALGVGSDKRNPLLPDVPPVSEVLPGFVSQVWYGMVAPPKTPAAIANKLSSAIAEILKHPDVVKQLQDNSFDAIGNTSAEMAQFMKQERERWGNLIRATGTRVE
jgi:tripartite-type tricarboxylate transporter receptor subunit TctC